MNTPTTPNPDDSEFHYYCYHVSILEMEQGAGGFSMRTAQLEIFEPRPVTTIQDVNAMAAFIRREYGYRRPQITGFTLLRMVPASEVRGRS
jgi:hypothetical protein